MTSPSPPIGWKPVLAAIASARAFRIVAAVLFVLEIAAIPILSRIVPDTDASP